MGFRKSSIDKSTTTPVRAFLKAQYTEKAWKCHDAYDITTTSANLGQTHGAIEHTASSIRAANSIKAARIRSNVEARRASLDDWERRLEERERRLSECEDTLEGMATMCSRRSSAVLKALRIQWGRETAAYFHHGAGLLLITLVLSAILSIGAHWQVRTWQCDQWQGMACWGVLGYTVIAGLSYLARLWVEERAVDTEASGAFIFACLLPFLHLLTCLIAAFWSVGISTVCHAE